MIKLDDLFVLIPDANSWILIREEKKVKQGKEVVSRDRWYCSNIERALKRYANESLKESSSVEEILQRLDDLNEMITKEFKKKLT